jgi:hypothetical protein
MMTKPQVVPSLVEASPSIQTAVNEYRALYERSLLVVTDIALTTG